jgi:hypothetical protein
VGVGGLRGGEFCKKRCGGRKDETEKKKKKVRNSEKGRWQ